MCFLHTYASTRVKRKSFYRKSELQMFLVISSGQTVHRYGVSIQSSTKVREMFRQMTQKLWATKTWDLEKLFISVVVFYNISFSWLFPLDSFQFIFLCRVYAWQWKWRIVGFHMTSLKFKLQNYQFYRDFTFTMYRSSWKLIFRQIFPSKGFLVLW